MRILYVAQQYDYGQPAQGYSFEHYNFYESLVAMGHEVDYFPTDVYLSRLGREALNDLLQQRVDSGNPDLLFACLYQEELDIAVMSALSSGSSTVTYNWFCDDHWRFDDFSRRWAPAFNWVSTTDRAAVAKYHALGYHNVIKTQWAANTSRYRPPAAPTYRHEVAFVGQVYGARPEMIRALRRSGVSVEAYGTGWAVRRRDEWLARRAGVAHLYGARRLARIRAQTRITQDAMIDLFGTTRINLNFTDASQGMEPQIKGRTFEVPACGGFLMTGPAEDLDRYLLPDREVVVFGDLDELIEKVRWYLGHDEERAAIAKAGYERTVTEHSYARRFADIFATMGLPSK